MKSRELGLVVCVIAFCAAASVWREPPTSPGSPPSAAVEEVDTESGSTKIRVADYSLAGLRPGMSRTEVGNVLALAVPATVENWTCGPSESPLNLSFFGEHLIAVGGVGRWPLTRAGKTLPGFMRAQSEVRAALGEPNRVDKQVWIYTNLPGELTFHFHDGVVTQVYLVGLLYPDPPKSPPKK